MVVWFISVRAETPSISDPIPTWISLQVILRLIHDDYRAFHQFGQTKFAYGGKVLGSSQFPLLPQLPQKMTLASKVVKIDSRQVISLRYAKSVTHSVEVTLTHKVAFQKRELGQELLMKSW